jgi:hypothetical protein
LRPVWAAQRDCVSKNKPNIKPFSAPGLPQKAVLCVDLVGSSVLPSENRATQQSFFQTQHALPVPSASPTRHANRARSSPCCCRRCRGRRCAGTSSLQTSHMACDQVFPDSNVHVLHLKRAAEKEEGHPPRLCLGSVFFYTRKPQRFWKVLHNKL